MVIFFRQTRGIEKINVVQFFTTWEFLAFHVVCVQTRGRESMLNGF